MYRSMFILRNEDYIKYTWNHKKAFLKVEKILLGKNTIRGYLHDVDKLFMYMFLSKKLASKLHRKYSHYHIIKHISKVKTIADYKLLNKNLKSYLQLTINAV